MNPLEIFKEYPNLIVCGSGLAAIGLGLKCLINYADSKFCDPSNTPSPGSLPDIQIDDVDPKTKQPVTRSLWSYRDNLSDISKNNPKSKAVKDELEWANNELHQRLK